jgi:hypothetical protein
LSFTTTAGYTSVVDAVLTRIATVVIANCSAHGTTALDSTLLAWPTTAVMASQPVWRTAAFNSTSAGIFAADTSAKPTLRTAFSRFYANFFLSTTSVTAYLFLRTTLAPEAYPVCSTVVTMLTLKTAISLISSTYYSQIFIVDTFPPLSTSVNNWRLITRTLFHAFLVIYFTQSRGIYRVYVEWNVQQFSHQSVMKHQLYMSFR